jgi:hypothetical protein
MKYLFMTLLLLAGTFAAVAQEEDNEERKGFKRENIFLGTSLNVGIGNGGYVLGGNPQFGYSIAQWLDAGITTNLIYASQRYLNFGREVRQRSFNYGGGPFVRVFPINMIHLQAQYEYNWTSGNVQDIGSGQRQKFKVDAPSFLVGAGYGQRVVGRSSFYTTILFDLTKDVNSPYVLIEGNQKIAMPVFRAGFNIYLGPKKR